MDIIIESPGFKASNELEAYVRETLSKLKSDKIIRADVTLYKDSDGNPANNFCEIRLEVPGNDHFVKRSAGTFETAVLDATETLQEMLKKTKEKAIDRNRQVDMDSILQQ